MTPKLARLFGTALLALPALPALALYKVVQPDGSITYTDRPPASGDVSVFNVGRGAATAPAGTSMPIELRQAMRRYPVTLYTSPDCAPCVNGRRLLQQRGVPYSERLVTSEEDAAALERAVGGRTVPALTIGAQPLRGLSESDWTAFLDAAGYPRESRLPRGWQPQQPAPLVERMPVRPAAVEPAPALAPESPAVELPPPGTLRF